MKPLIYPNLFYFVYDLREGLGEDSREVEENQKIFTSKFQESISVLNSDTIFETEYYELLAPKQPPIKQFSETDYEGYYYPVRLNDTYGLLVACSPKETTQCFEIQNIISKLKSKIDEKLPSSNGLLHEGTLGQTWMLLAHVPESLTPHYQEIAKDCYEQLAPKIKGVKEVNWDRDLQGQGCFMGGVLFELGQYKNQLKESPEHPSRRRSVNQRIIPSIQDISQSYHIVIALYPNAQSAKKAAELNFSWMRIFCYRHKILWAYSQSRYLKQKLKKNYEDTQKYINSFRKENENASNLNKLRKSLFRAGNLLSNYAIDLKYFADQIRTIEINLLNYQRRIELVNELAKKEYNLPLNSLAFSPHIEFLISQINIPELEAILERWTGRQLPVNLKFLENFSTTVQEKYLVQALKDYDSLSPGLNLLEDLINSIRGVTELDQAQRDRNFQTAVGIVGIGLAIGASLASISGQFPPIKTNQNLDVSHNIIASALLSLGISKPWLSAAISMVITFGASLVSIIFIYILWQLLGIIKFFILRSFKLFNKIIHKL
ncbi:hypothetical protein [Planktothrix agardhii]|jgi:hypothetical protein|uniref:hypothetical protein n=1 Tax=Planktothrix agardhii TaxID=1160 RepID=UPI001F321A50|nr:hypothetical protein [Planktothrix agardhii]MCF3578544.1 hypothetical protein [Planktothrix agardhii 1812]MCF3583307.1 hypothetical protein [Planktothrix agardhii 1811]